MGTKKKKSMAKATKQLIREQVEAIKALPPKAEQKYEATMDNVIIECLWNKQPENEPYQYPHNRGVDKVMVLSAGPMVNNVKIKKGAVVSVSSYGHELVRDEVSAISVIKAHEILLFIK